MQFSIVKIAFLVLVVPLANAADQDSSKFMDAKTYNRRSFMFGSNFKRGGFESRIWSEIGNGKSTGNLESNQDFTKLLNYNDSQLEAYLRRNHGKLNKPEYFEFLRMLNDKLIKFHEWIDYQQPYLLPNLFDYEYYRIFKPSEPGYFAYLSQRGSFYSLLAKFILVFSLIK